MGLFHHLRNQMTFAIQLILLIGVRPNEIVESDAWCQSNNGLHYRKLTLLGSKIDGNMLCSIPASRSAAILAL